MTVNRGDTVTIAYRKDYSGDKLDDCIYLRNFQLAELHTLTIIPEDSDGNPVSAAEIVLKDSKGDTVSGSKGAYVIEDGTYNYTISSFGFETIETGTVIINGTDKTEKVLLIKKTTQKVSFNISLPDGLTSSQLTTEVKSLSLIHI